MFIEPYVFSRFYLLDLPISIFHFSHFSRFNCILLIWIVSRFSDLMKGLLHIKFFTINYYQKGQAMTWQLINVLKSLKYNPISLFRHLFLSVSDPVDCDIQNISFVLIRYITTIGSFDKWLRDKAIILCKSDYYIASFRNVRQFCRDKASC